MKPRNHCTWCGTKDCTQPVTGRYQQRGDHQIYREAMWPHYPEQMKSDMLGIDWSLALQEDGERERHIAKHKRPPFGGPYTVDSDSLVTMLNEQMDTLRHGEASSYHVITTIMTCLNGMTFDKALDIIKNNGRFTIDEVTGRITVVYFL